MRWYKSLYSKILFGFVVVFSITPIVLLVFTQTRFRTQLIDQQITANLIDIENLHDYFITRLDEARADLLVLSQLPSLENFLLDPDADNRQALEQTFSVFLNRQPYYSQVRLLNESGIERVRVNMLDDTASIVAEDNLQDKSSRGYFQEIINAELNDIYVSDINLNQENGIIEEPYTPTVRFGMRLIDADGESYVLIFNMLTDPLFSHLFPASDTLSFSIITHSVVNENSDIMFTTNPDEQAWLYASDLGHDRTAQTLFPNLPTDLAESLVYETDKSVHIYYPISIDSLNTTRQWQFISTEPVSAISAPIRWQIQNLFIVIVFGLVGSAIISVVIASSIVQPIQTLVRSVLHLHEQDWQSSISVSKAVNTEDEIHDLALAIEDVVLKLQAVYNTMENQIRERTLELQWANEQLSAVDQAKTQFMQNLAHDIASPLTSISLNIGMIQQHPEVTDRSVSRIKIQLERLKRMVSTMNSISKIELTADILAFEPLHIAEIVQRITRSYQSSIESAGLSLSLDIAPDISIIEGHPFMLEQLFENLLSNAIKYTPIGSISIRLTESQDTIVLVVKDTGLGISKDELPFITRRFYRTADAEASTVSGTGIGLSIVQETIQIHRGKLDIQSTFGEGTAFTVTLPITQNNNTDD